ncbi:protein kinase domain-containing protein [Pyxidicoccus xibeiensis]|uniref:protein kinase domain-containing protein n=1 Tax=Pyxidicoccus xibeiensis TaxID=2906759 RepID=UPI0020A7070E|nr:protein kinase [Pyxidicoccus xibeiensis]MCP3144100.1 protein kinase [Pyxidicoccus xibeiensis]
MSGPTRDAGAASNLNEELEPEDTFPGEATLEGGGQGGPLPALGERLGGPDGDRYEVVRLLGSGGMGRVFSALDRVLRRPVALKFLFPRKGLTTPELLTGLRDEARAVARLDHENILRIHDVTEWETSVTLDGKRVPLKVPFLVMEHLEGESLHTLLRRERPGLLRALDLMADVAAGLAHAHERHLVHRDLKPGNVFVLRDGRAKLLDFGLARTVTQTASGDTALAGGTPAYMAPEQWRGEPHDARADVWSAGVLFYELLTGAHPLPKLRVRELRARLLSVEPLPSPRERRPELPRELERLLASVLSKDPRQRPAGGAELAARLRVLREELAPDAPRDSRSGRAGQRLVSLVSCQLLFTPGNAGRMDAEDGTEAVAAFHHGCARIVHHHGGAITAAVGTEVLACFGHPVTREDDAERAVHAALQLVQALPAEAPRSGDFSVRVGVHTDRVAMAESLPTHAGAGPAIHGEAPGVAARLSALAEPGMVLLSEGTHALVRGVVQSRSLGRRTFAGLSGTSWVEVHQVLQARPDVSRFDRALVVGALTPLVGRERELEQLTLFRDQVLVGQGALVLLRGEAGIGKSRLLQELHDREPPGTSTWLRCQCWLRDAASAFHPLLCWLQRDFGFAADDPQAAKTRKLEQRLEALGMSPSHRDALMSLFRLPLDEGSSFLHLSPELQRAAVLEALVAFVHHEAGRRPLVLVMEDVHWADPSTLQFLGVLLDRLADTRTCALLTCRAGFKHSWTGRPGFHELELEPLSQEASALMVRQVPGSQALDAETVSRVVRGADGVPLYVEELTRVALGQETADAAAPPRGPLQLPASLHALLLARLDQLTPRQRAQAQLAATLGREFSYDMLRAVSFLREEDLLPELAGLERAGLLFRQGEPPFTLYTFKHALVQEAAYQSLLRSTRQRYHARIVEVVGSHFPEVVEEQPEVLAQHAALAGLAEQAVEHWRHAGQLAGARSAIQEAIGHYTRALEQLSLLPASPERDPLEIALCGELGQALVSAKGFAAPEVQAIYARARALCDPGGDVPLPVLWGLWNAAFVGGDREGADQFAALFRRRLDPHGELETGLVLHSGLSVWSMWRGAYADGRRHGLEVERLLERPEGQVLLSKLLNGNCTGYLAVQLIYAHLSVALCEMVLGHAGQARERYTAALALAETMRHPYVLATSLMFGATLALEAGDARAARDCSERALALSATNGFLFVLADSYCIQGWALAHLGEPDRSVCLAREGVRLFRATGARLLFGASLSCLAQACLSAGQLDEGLAATREGLSHVDTAGARYSQATLLRLQAELLYARGDVGAARASFEAALAEARGNGAKLHELRAALGLARLLRATGEVHGVRPLLEGLCDSLPEAQGLSDVQAARTLLASLG